MRTFKQKVTIGGIEHEIEVTLPEGYLAPNEISAGYVAKDTVEGLVKDRLKRRSNKLRGELLDDEEFLSEIATSHKDKLIQLIGVTPKAGPDIDVDKLTQQIKDREVTPLQTTIKQLQERIQKSQGKSLKGDVATAAAELGVDLEESGNLELIEIFFERRSRYNEEHDQHFIAEGDEDFALTSRPEKGKPLYRTIREELELMKESGKYAGWFKGEQRPGAGADPTKTHPGKQTIDEQIAAAEAAGNHGLVTNLNAQKLQQMRG